MNLQLIRATLLSCILLLFTAISFAQTTTTYIAIANGNYTNASTWAGGIKPPSILGTTNIDIVMIPNGITVTLDTNIILNYTSSTTKARLSISGTLNGLPGYYIGGKPCVHGAATGIINIDSMVLWGSDFQYAGVINADVIYSSEFTLSYGNETINVKKKFIIGYYHSTVIRGTVNIGNHCTIERQGATGFSVTGGTFNVPDTVNIILSQHVPLTSGLPYQQLDSNWMKYKIDTFIIDIDTLYSFPRQGYRLVMLKDLDFNGTMIIKSGNLDLDKHKLTFGPNAKLYCTPKKGRIMADRNAEIIVNATSDFGGGFIFWDETINSSPKDTIKNFTVNMGNSTGTVKLRNNLVINNTLDLLKGQLHLVDSANLIIDHNTNATITNASTNSYITNDFGTATHMNVAGSSTATFPVGTPAHYAPIDVKNNSSTEVYKVGAVAGVKDTVVTGFDIATQEPCVAATWWVNPSATTGSNADVTIKWPSALEVNSFNRSQSYITTYLYNQLKWDTQTTTSAAGTQGSFYTQTQTVNNFDTGKSNFFSVFDGATSLANLSVNSSSSNNKITLYPNPTSGNATIGMTLENSQTIAITLTDVSGRIVYVQPVAEYNSGQHTIALPTQNLTNGIYFLQLTSEQGTLLNSGKLMKQ